MSERIFVEQESPKLVGFSSRSEITVNTFCGPNRILEDEKTRICLEISVDSSGYNCTFCLTPSQALKLAEEIQNVYREMLRPEDSD